MQKRYAIGMDFGTLSARAVILDTETGKLLEKDSLYVYPHGILQKVGEKELPLEYALADPADYDEALAHVLREVVKVNGIDAGEVMGIGIDCTACSVLPVDRAGEPLCFDPVFADEPHAYVKLWKHHGAEKYMERIHREAKAFGESFPERSGTGITSEFYLPKVLETAEEAPAVFDAADRFMNLGDYLVRRLTGNSLHSSAYAAIKEGWDPEEGFPTDAYLSALNPRLCGFFEKKTDLPVAQAGSFAGRLTPEWAARTGLPRETAVAVPIIDAHGTFPLAGIEEGLALLSIGTSGGFCLNAEGTAKPIPGVMSCGKNALADGMMTYDAGLSTLGDLFDWFVTHQVPSSYEDEARARGMNVHALLSEKAETKRAGESGLLALGWWRGNRCTLADDRLSGLVLGLRTSTRPEDIYRALVESTAFGMRRIMENYTTNGLPVKRIVATGGIALKNPMLMQIYADVMKCEIGVIATSQSTAGGSAVYGAVAGGKYPDIFSASLANRAEIAKVYSPHAESAETYDALYGDYLRLCDYFGQGENDVMKRLHETRRA